jgi:hypothetical protein
MIVTKRMRTLYRLWYQPNVYMELEDWIYIAQLIVSCVLAFGFGLLVGFLL